MDRIKAIKILEHIREGMNPTHQEAVNIAINDMRYTQNKIDRHKKYERMVADMTKEDWQDTMQAIRDAWGREE